MANTAAPVLVGADIDSESNRNEPIAVTTAQEVWEQRRLPTDSPLLRHMEDSQWLRATQPVLRDLVDAWLHNWDAEMEKSISDNLCMRSLARRFRPQPEFQTGRPAPGWCSSRTVSRCCKATFFCCTPLVFGVVLYFLLFFILIALAILVELFVYPVLFLAKCPTSGKANDCMKKCDPGIWGFVLFFGLPPEPSVLAYVSEQLYTPETIERINRSLQDMNIHCCVEIGRSWQQDPEEGRVLRDCWAWSEVKLAKAAAASVGASDVPN